MYWNLFNVLEVKGTGVLSLFLVCYNTHFYGVKWKSLLVIIMKPPIWVP